MIKNFDEVKNQLKELSGIINGFKSEAVQLRIVELIFGVSVEEEQEKPEETPTKPRKKSSKKKRNTTASSGTAAKKSTKKASGQGAVSTLIKLVEDGFFGTPKTIGDIVEHCDHNLARKFKANEFSGKLGRLVREGTLKRTKNSESQYEYQS